MLPPACLPLEAVSALDRGSEVRSKQKHTWALLCMKAFEWASGLALDRIFEACRKHEMESQAPRSGYGWICNIIDITENQKDRPTKCSFGREV